MGRDIYANRDRVSRQDQIRISMLRVLLVVCFLQPVLIFSAYGVENRFLTTGLTRARALAMGSAYHSLEDEFSAGFYNPGAFKLNTTRYERNFKLFFNPLAPVIGLYDYSNYNLDYVEDNKLTFGEALLSVGMFFKGIGITTPVVDMGIGIDEEVIDWSPQNTSSGHVFSVEGLTKCSFHSVFMNVKIAPPVSVGISGTLYSSRANNKTTFKGGYTCGVLLTPNPKMNVGIVYNKIPDVFSKARFSLECIEDETVTSGISYFPDNKTVLSMDLRAVNKENLPTSREIHTGIERRFGERIALRAGYYRKKATKNDILSFGIGILPYWEKISKFSNFVRSDLISYTLIIEENSSTRRWHILSLLLRC